MGLNERKIWVQRIFHNVWLYFCLDYRSCKLRLKLDIPSSRSRNINFYFYSTHFLPYIPVMHVEYSLRHGRWTVWLYKYFRNSLANCSFEGGGYSLFSIEYVLLHIFTTISKSFLIISGKFCEILSQTFWVFVKSAWFFFRLQPTLSFSIYFAKSL